MLKKAVIMFDSNREGNIALLHKVFGFRSLILNAFTNKSSYFVFIPFIILLSSIKEFRHN